MFCVLSTYRKPPQPLIDGDVIREALRYADISITKAAAWMEMDPRQLDRQLNGAEHLRHASLAKLPTVFHSWYHFLMLDRVRLPRPVRRGLPLQLALMGKRRMARMERAERKETKAS